MQVLDRQLVGDVLMATTDLDSAIAKLVRQTSLPADLLRDAEELQRTAISLERRLGEIHNILLLATP